MGTGRGQRTGAGTGTWSVDRVWSARSGVGAWSADRSEAWARSADRHGDWVFLSLDRSGDASPLTVRGWRTGAGQRRQRTGMGTGYGQRTASPLGRCVVSGQEWDRGVVSRRGAGAWSPDIGAEPGRGQRTEAGPGRGQRTGSQASFYREKTERQPHQLILH